MAQLVVSKVLDIQVSLGMEAQYPRKKAGCGSMCVSHH